MKMKKRIGRPPLAAGEVKAGRLYCRLLPAEIDEIKAAATAENKTQSEWVRAVLLEAARRQKP